MAKVLLSLDDRLLERIDREARGRGLSRSAYLRTLAVADLDERAGPGRGAGVRNSLRSLDALFAGHEPHGESTAAVRAERDSRSDKGLG